MGWTPWILWIWLRFGIPWILQWILRISIQELLRICQSLLWPLLVVIYHFGNPKTILSKLAKFYPPFELSTTNHQLLPSKTLKYLIFFFQKGKKEFTYIRFGHKEFFCFLIRECAKYQHHTAHRL